MNAEELFKKDGTPTGVFYCSECKTVSRDQPFVERCCKPTLCENCGEVAPKWWAICNDCKSEKNRISYLEKLEKATTIQDTDKFIYCEDYQGSREGYYETISDLLDELACTDEEITWPVVVTVCEQKPIERVGIDYILERIAEEGFEDILDHINGSEELQKALDAFYELNEGVVTWEVAYKEKIIIRKPDDWEDQ